MKQKVKIPASKCFKVARDGAMANTRAADGRLVPHLIIDVGEDEELMTLVKVHQDTIPGDVESQWGRKRFSSKSIYLILRFFRPIELELVVEFDMSKHHHVIDGIIQTRTAYIQPGAKGDKLSDDINAPKILIEIPARTTFDEWDKILKKHTAKKLRNEGVGRKDLKKAVDDYVALRRDVWGRRLK
ncbi:hypothetical protein ABMX85_22085 [Vibrio vulnificus]|uniref:hypothetical protein n=1 Tax=Vibrio vulnificus TaxID=672 RepID=UPI004058684C